jgi:hypothetical protein
MGPSRTLYVAYPTFSLSSPLVVRLVSFHLLPSLYRPVLILPCTTLYPFDHAVVAATFSLIVLLVLRSHRLNVINFISHLVNFLKNSLSPISSQIQSFWAGN